MDPVRVSFVSDVHGNIDGLARVAERAEQLVVLGDLLDYVDYHEHGNGILGEVFGAEKVGHFASLRATGSFGALHDYNRELWDSLDDAAGVLTEVVEDRYLQVLDAVGPDALVILGNVDVAAAWAEVIGPKLPNRDGQVVEVAGRRFGSSPVDPPDQGCTGARPSRCGVHWSARRPISKTRLPAWVRSTCSARTYPESSAAALRPCPGPIGDVRAGAARVHRPTRPAAGGVRSRAPTVGITDQTRPD